MNSSIELIFVPSPAAGHFVSAVEMAKLLVARDSRLCVSLLLLKLPLESEPNESAESLSSSTTTSTNRIKYIDLPQDKVDPAGFTRLAFFGSFESQKSHVRNAVRKIASEPGSPRLAGFVLDIFCTAMTDVADEFGVPSYVFFTSSAGFLCLMSRLRDFNHDRTEFEDELVVPGFANPVPEKALPSFLLDKDSAPLFYNMCRRISKAKGVLVNTFAELEPDMIKALSSLGCDKFPPVYPVGPMIRLDRETGRSEIIEWLDRQPPSSVVFLCFGSMGSFGGNQVREIAAALERSGVRFLWSLRRPPQKDKTRTPTDYENPAEALPEGFLERTAGVGRVVGWAPQAAVLARPAVGGFVSHCGWNSLLESVWFGVPAAAWPLYAEQQLNAFKMVKEYGLAVEIAIDYRKSFNAEWLADDRDLVVRADEIVRGIRRVMESDSDTRKRVKEMSEKSRNALLHAGSSYASLSRFIIEVMGGFKADE